MPTAPAGETAVADVGRLYAALNTQYPGLATISERWRVGDGLKPDARPRAAPDRGRARRRDARPADPRRASLALRILAAPRRAGRARGRRPRGRRAPRATAAASRPSSRRSASRRGRCARRWSRAPSATAAVGLAAGLLGGAALTNRFPDLLALGADGRRPLPGAASPRSRGRRRDRRGSARRRSPPPPPRRIQARRAFRGDVRREAPWLSAAIDARKLFVVHESATGNVVSLQGASLQASPASSSR